MSEAFDKTLILQNYLSHNGVGLSFDDVEVLRRAQMVLSRWAEGECGDEHGSCIERDDSGIPFRAYNGAHGTSRYRIPDRESGALRRIADVCERNGLFFFHQNDPRGCALWVSRVPLDDSNYSTLGFYTCD